MPNALLIATGNAGKVKEIRHELDLAAAASHDSFLASLTLLGLKDLPSPPPECVEDQPTFEGNAQKKARHYAALSGMLTLADDSGLCVDALGGAPGVYSARYAGISGPHADEANNAKLLAALDHIPDDQRQAHFACAMALAAPVRPSGFSLSSPDTAHTHAANLALAFDHVPGILLRAPRGTHGFGYDPLFYFPQFSKTTAELDLTTKSQISHRGKALRKMIAWLHENHASLPPIH